MSLFSVLKRARAGALQRRVGALQRRCLAGKSGDSTVELDPCTIEHYFEEAAVINDECGVVDGLVGPLHLRPSLRVPGGIRGIGIAHDPLYNKGTGFDHGERDRLGLRGLLPPRALTMEQQMYKTMASLRVKSSDLEKHMFLSDLHDRNETLFHRVLVRHTEEIAPLIYTPTVGEACLKFGSTFRRPRGMYFSLDDVGHMKAMVHNWPGKDVRVVVVTDGGRILGLGDLGASGMGIPIGKLALYCAAGGIAPHRVMPVVLDVGTDNQKLLDDPFYLGLKRRRLTGAAYDQVVHEFMEAVYERWPKVLVQFEDFSSNVALPILQRYKDHRLCFNDDVQGTGATVSSGVLSCMRLQGGTVTDVLEQRILVCGAGSAGLGVAAALRDTMVAASGGKLTCEEATRKFWIIDEQGLLSKDGMSPEAWANLTPDQQAFAFAFEGPGLKRGTSLLNIIKTAKPTILLGLTTVGGLFNEEIVKAFAAGCEKRPIIMPLSNPTSRAECSAEQAYAWTNGNAIFASGSPFAAVQLGGKTLFPSQCNNMFIFPGVGLGASLAEATKVSDQMLYAASVACAEAVDDDEIARGQVFPSVRRIRTVSMAVACAVIRTAISESLVRNKDLLEPNLDLEAYVAKKMYFPVYVPLYQSPYE
ncbi:hypothetical protein M885DRAFT_623684 [Pelagophyceae sp. CCMP2097]|nr:hypothetical protein M885DRAFT_623684 [Pelagophyceae sp. CCMP2097]